MRALEDWLHASDTKFGPVFRKIDRWGTIENRRLGTDAIRRILARPHPAATASHPGHGMTRSAAANATAASDALLAWLRDQPPPVFPPARRARRGVG